MPIKIKSILLPKNLNVDAIVSLAVLYEYGSKVFRGLMSAGIEFRASLPEGHNLEY
ncbi:hypothetical protein K8R66_02245 [bacterium]|nr:hypothetical protein [bacterium]